MSLTAAQRAKTAAELQANLELAGLDRQQLAGLTGWTAQRVASTLELNRADPVDVWQLRDLLEQSVRDTGRTPVPFTVLNERARSAAQGWFGIR